MSARRVIKVACAIIERDRRFLTTRRGTGQRALLWEFPGGKCRPGETTNACIVREIREELGITVRPLRELPPVRWRYPDVTIILHPVVCRYQKGRIVLHGHTAAKWIIPTEASQYTWCGADQPILEEYLVRRRPCTRVFASRQ